MAEFRNSLQDYSTIQANTYLTTAGDAVSSKFHEKLRRYRDIKLKILTLDMKSELFCEGSSVYTGSSGLAFYYLMSAMRKKPVTCHETAKKALEYININKLKGQKISFLCGDAGPLTLMIIISYMLKGYSSNIKMKPEELVQRLLSLNKLLKDSPDELLYGKVGYLYSLMLIKNYISEDNVIPELTIKEVINSILTSGKKLSAEIKAESPLMWQWHDKIYLGAAHGYAGILYMLLQARAYIDSHDMDQLIRPTIDWLTTQRFEGGNFSSSLGSKSGDRLVQWCHGAPGFVPLYISAYQVFEDKKYLDVAIKCGEVIWERGLCRKGYSICHGVSGNAYAFLQLYQVTKEPQHLHRACAFMEWCMDERPGTEQHKPDRPASLFEGLLGRIYLAEDIMDPLNSKFPAFCL
ncbi:lanC-like protein 2 isoform X1 [Aricia agestis]|uniref:lanC-like protein 2 isoform X1 n=1 Tax=Aricia agestis TaxID=91739 RepID=UPI001C20601E|nr:lanC-like protein 2 isoform X1 [Aricia agestis]